MCYDVNINNIKTENTIEDLIATFFKQGGRIDNFYLRNQKKGPTLVYLNGWHSGRNIRDAISQAYASQ